MSELWGLKLKTFNYNIYFFCKRSSYIPRKKPKNGKLSLLEKEYNRTLAQERIVIEHVNRSLKIFKILSSRYRNRRRRYGLRCNLLSAIYNYELALGGLN